MNENVQQAVSEQQLLESYTKAYKNLVAFRSILLPTGDHECEPAPFHFEWSSSLLDGTGHEAFEAFRESAKTQYILRAFPLYNLTFPQKKFDYVVFIKNNATLAHNKLKEISKEYLENPALNSNLVKVHTDSGEAFEVDVKDANGEIVNIRYEAYGKGASIRGLSFIDRRPKIIIIDDPQDAEDAKSETILKTDWDWFTDDVMFLGKHTRIFLIGNNLGERCIIERVFNGKDELKFRCRRIPVMDENSNPTWPAHDTAESILSERAAYNRLGKLDTWLRNKMCVSVSKENQIFDPDKYRYYTPALAGRLAGEAQQVIAMLDPASSKDKSSCFRAIVVIAVMADGHWYTLEIPYGRWDPETMIDKIFYVVMRWGVRNFGIEKGMLKDVIEPFIIKEMTRRNVRFTITPLEHGKAGSKLERIKMLQPRVNSGSLWFPDEAYWLEELKSEMAGVTKDEIKSMFIDLVDAMAMGEQLVAIPLAGKPVENPQRRITNLPRRAIT